MSGIGSAKVIDGGSNKMDQWIKEMIHIGRQDKSVNGDEGSYQLSHIDDKTVCRNNV